MEKKSFKLPQAFLSQLEEFTSGFCLVTIDDEGNFSTFLNTASPVAKLGLVSFLTMFVDNLNAGISIESGEDHPENCPDDGEAGAQEAS